MKSEHKTVSSSENIAKKLEILAKEKENARQKLVVIAKQLAVTAKEKESIRRKLLVTAQEKEREKKQKEEGERTMSIAKAKDQEEKKKKIGAGFSAVVWVFSFIAIWSNLDWAKSIGFETSQESTDALMELLMYSIAHIISIPFVLWRGVKIDRQNEELEGVRSKIYASSFNIRLVLVLIFVGIIVWMVAPNLTNEPREARDIRSQLEAESQTMNASLPFMFDSETQLFMTFVSDDMKFNIEFILVNMNISDVDWNELRISLEDTLETHYCNHPTIAFFRDNQVPIVWNYYTKDKIKIGEIEKGPSDCR